MIQIRLFPGPPIFVMFPQKLHYVPKGTHTPTNIPSTNLLGPLLVWLPQSYGLLQLHLLMVRIVDAWGLT